MGWLGLIILIVIILVSLLLILGYDDTVKLLDALFSKSETVIKEGAQEIIDSEQP